MKSAGENIILYSPPELSADPEVRTMLKLARELGFDVRDDPPDPARESLDRRTLVWLDLWSTDPSPKSRPAADAWERRTPSASSLVICATREPPRTGDGPAYRHWLTASEQLRALALRHAGDEALLGCYQQGPDLYERDRGEPPGALRQRMRDACGAGLRWPRDWSEALALLRAPERYREMGDLVFVTYPKRLPAALVIEAAVCIGRARHHWWESGATLEDRPFLLLPLEHDRPPGCDPAALGPVIEGARIYLSEAKAAALRRPGLHPRAADAKGFKPHFDEEWRPEPPPGQSVCGKQGFRVLEQPLSRAIARLWLRGRPLRHYGCTLLFPFDPGPAHQERFDQALGRRVKAEEERSDPRTVRLRHHCYGTQDPPEQVDETQARLYFLPHLSEVLFEEEARAGSDQPKPIREWRLTATEISDWRLFVHQGRPGDESETVSIAADVASVRLLRYFNGCYLLALRVVVSDPAGELTGLCSDDADWWHPAAFGSSDAAAAVRRRAFGDWLGFTRLARILYPSFAEQHAEQKIARLELRLRPDQGESPRFEPSQGLDRVTLVPGRPGAALSPILRLLLARFFGEQPGGLELNAFLDRHADVYDDRLFVNVAYALAGPIPTPPSRKTPEHRPRGGEAHPEPPHGALRRLFALALFVDRFEDARDECDGYAYDPDWTKKALETYSPGLWDATGVCAGFTDSANVHLGASGFFAEVIAPRHVPYEYERMLMQALFYQASLRRYNREISVATRRLIDDERDGRRISEEFRDLRRGFIDFTNRYWFRDVTAQMQGRQVFALQQQALGLDAEYHQIKDEMERADEYAEASRNKRLAEISYLVGSIGLWVAFAAIWVSLLPLVPADGSIAAFALEWPPDTVMARIRSLFWLAVAPPAAAAVVVLLFLWMARRVWKRWGHQVRDT